MIILLIGLNIFKPEVKWQALLPLFAWAGGGGHVCRGRGSEARPSILPVQLPEASHLSVPDLTRTERKSDHWQEGDFFPPPPFSFSEVNRMSAPSDFAEESNYSLELTLAVQRKRPTWQPLDINPVKWKRVPSLLCRERPSRLIN